MTPPEQPPTGGPPTDKRIHVLLVDDAQDLAEMVAEYIERNHDDIRVTTATSAVTAFSELTETDVDCIVSDYRMPAVDGLEFLEAVRERDQGIAFILFTNKGSDAIAGTAMEAGVTAYVEKGTDPNYDTLVEHIREAADGSAARSP